jgi:hypothetical protein
MSECDEVAATMLARVIELGGLFWSLDNFRNYVRTQMRDESVQVIDNVAFSLFQQCVRLA